MKENEYPSEELLKDIPIIEEDSKEEQRENPSVVSTFSKPISENFADMFLKGFMDKCSTIAEYIIENRDSIENALSVIDYINSLSEKEKKELGEKIDEALSSAPEGEQERHDRNNLLCKIGDMDNDFYEILRESNKYYKPNKFLTVNSKDWRTVFEDSERFSGEEGALLPIQKDKDISNYIHLIFPENFHLEKKLTKSERSFADGSLGFLYHGIKTFSPEQLYEYTRNRKPTDKRLKELITSLDKMSVMKCSQKWTKQAKLNNYLGKNPSQEELDRITVTYEDYFLPLSKTVIENILKLTVGKKYQGSISSYELGIESKDGLILPCGETTRWEKI